MPNIKIVFKYALKDLSRQKVRSFIAIFGVMVSVALLAIVLFLSDSISVTFIDYLSIDAGNQDIVINVRHYNGEPPNRSIYFDYQPVMESIRGNVSEIENIIPRMELGGYVNVSRDLNTQELTNEEKEVFISGINLTLENQINFGSFVRPNTNQILDLTDLPLYHCAIYHEFNDEIKYSENDTIEIKMSLEHGNMTLSHKINFTVDKIFDFQLKWPINYKNRNLVIVDIETIYMIFGNETFNGKCDDLILTIKGDENFYDARDIQGTENRVKDLAGEIQILIGMNEYYINLPKLRALGFSELLSVGITIILVFVSMVSMIISGVMINGILKTSVEERIREFGIFRTLGGTKKYNLSIVLVQGFLLCNFGTISGIILASLSTRFLLLPIAEIVVGRTIPGLAGNISFSITLWSILLSYIIGIVVGLVVSISPAARVMRLQLIESIHPYRHEDTLYHLQKKASVNYKLIIVGVILAINGAFVLLVIPRILISLNTSLMAGTLIALLLVFLMGTTLAGIGLMPLMLRFFLQVFRLVSKRLHHVISIFVFRYQRRNSSTIIIFAFTFSFVIFTAATTRFLSDQVEVEANLNFGSDLVIDSQGWKEPEGGSFGIGFGGGGFFSQSDNNPLITVQDDGFQVNPNRILTSDFKNELLKIEGIEKVSSVISNPFHLTQIYSEEGKDFSAELGDYAGLLTREISLIGIDEEYPSTINTKYIEFTKGDFTSSFDQLFSNQLEYTCIISHGLSNSLDLELGNRVRIVIQRGDETEIYTFKIVGVAASMPGFYYRFGRSSASAVMGGVMVSQETYIELLDIPPIPYLDRIFVKLNSYGLQNRQDIITNFTRDFRSDYDFRIINLQTLIRQQQSLFAILDIFFTMTLDATIVICLFGLISSSYSTIIERKKEVGIVRTLGLKGKEINRLFTIEAYIIMLSSGTIGVIVGWLTGLLLSTSVNLLSDLPNVPRFPLSNMILIYIVSIIFVFIGMKLLLRKIRKKKIVDIYRETM